MGVTSMAHWILSAAIIIAVLILFALSYSFLQFLLTIAKCPDCGRIMQKVVYTDLMDEENKTIVNECRFCQSKRFKKGQLPITHRKHTLYP
jgi:DNA-directed RNA polymerase subunit RPC12/RpoP